MAHMKMKGFTLIELLVVIAIIGLLSTIIAGPIQNARKKGRDAKRMSDLKALKLALETYYIDNGTYPPSACGYDCNGYYLSYDPVGWAALGSYLIPTYLSRMPLDPTNTGCTPWSANCYSYAYGNVGQTTYAPQYDLTTQLEDGTNQATCLYQNYKFYFAGANPWCVQWGGTYSNKIFEASDL